MPSETAEITKNVKEYTDAKQDGLNASGLSFDEIFRKAENSGRERSEVNSLLNPAIMNDPDARAAINADLQAKGLLPDLLISEFDNLDTDKDGKISKEESQAIQNDYQNKDAVTVIAADAALGSADAIDKNGDGISRDELEAYKRENPAPAETATDVLAEQSTEQPAENQKDARLQILEDPTKTMEEKLIAARDYAKDHGGNVEVELTNPDGTTMKVRIEVNAVGSNGRELVHLYVKKEGGGETIALRGVSDAEGAISSQKKKDGTDAGLVGDKWKAEHEESLFG